MLSYLVAGGSETRMGTLTQVCPQTMHSQYRSGQNGQITMSHRMRSQAGQRTSADAADASVILPAIVSLRRCESMGFRRAWGLAEAELKATTSRQGAELATRGSGNRGTGTSASWKG